MRVLSINTSNFQPKTTNVKQVKNSNFQQQPIVNTNVPSFKSNAGVAATIIGGILGGAALLFAAPIAIVAGAAAIGAVGGAAMSEDDEPYNDVDRYKYTHEY